MGRRCRIKKKVMIVDDDPSILIVIRELLEPEGFEVFTVNCGKDCIEEIKKSFRGVILMDIMMPVMNGWDAIKEIVDQGYAEGNIIAILTAKDAPDQKMAGLKEYVIDYITKPYDPKELVANVKEYFTYLK